MSFDKSLRWTGDLAENGVAMASQLESTGRLASRVALVGACASAVLAGLNITVGVLENSTSVVATGVEFAGDVLASAVVFFGMVVAIRPADADHPYGHGRFESLAAFVVGLVLAVGGLGICGKSLQKVGELHPPPGKAAVAVLLFAIGARGVMSIIKFRVGRRLQSSSLIADAWNDAVDIVAAAVALTAVGLATYDQQRFLTADHYGGFAVGIIVILTGVRVLRDASLELVDTMPAGEMIARARAVAAEIPGVLGVEKAHARKTGFKYHVDLHIQVDSGLTVAASHVIAGRVRSHLRAELGWVADALVHVEPAPATAAKTAEPA